MRYQTDLSQVEGRCFFSHSFQPLQLKEQLAALAEFQHENHKLSRFKGIGQLYKKRRVQQGHDISLVEHDLLLLFRDDELLVDQLECIKFPRVLLSD